MFAMCNHSNNQTLHDLFSSLPVTILLHTEDLHPDMHFSPTASPFAAKNEVVI